jgi:uncharacterized protein YecT (DUF1311 family)
MKMTSLSDSTVAVILTLLALSTPVAHADEYPKETKAKAICATVAGFKPGPNAQPTDEDRKRFAVKTEDCLDYVYGYADPKNRDLDKGRRCCLAQGDCNRELAMIFANGWGTPRDYDAATFFLCKTDNEMAAFETWSMLAQLQVMRSAANPKDLDYCDYLTSGRGATWCEGLENSRRSPEWDRRIEAVSKSLGEPAREAFERLRKAVDDFVEKDADLGAEDSRGGTAHTSFVVVGERERTEAFIGLLERYTRAPAPRATPEALRTADRELNTIYQEKLKLPPCPTCGEFTATTRDILRDAQRSWLRYRDAWTAFYRLRWQGAAPAETLDREIDTLLTQDRAAALRKLGEEN